MQRPPAAVGCTDRPTACPATTAGRSQQQQQQQSAFFGGGRRGLSGCALRRSRAERLRGAGSISMVASTSDPAATKKKGSGGKKQSKPTIPLPTPGPYQQTLQRSFTIGGLGLHTGEYTLIRVRPALAGEGRYFVRVPPGANSHRFRLPEDEMVPLGEWRGGEEPDPEAEDRQVALFMEYLSDFHGEALADDSSFPDWLKARGEPVFKAAQAAPEREVLEDDRVTPRSDGEEYVLASIEAAEEGYPGEHLFTSLSNGQGFRVSGVEHLLSALEACGVDNARIEVEVEAGPRAAGGPASGAPCEVPIVDGSALGWVIEVQTAGLAPARYGDKERVRKVALAPREPLLVRGEGGAFVQLVPEPRCRLSVGVDHAAECEVIGKQWVTWAPEEDAHYRWEVAPARNYASSVSSLYALRAAGFVRGGTQGCTIVGYGDRWYEPQAVRFFNDEPARHRLLDLVGDLSLLSMGGYSGLPLGHIVAYKADHALTLRFIRALKAGCSDDDFVPVKTAGE